MSGRERWVLTVLCAAQLMLIVDVVALNVALPSMRRSLDIPVGQLQLTGVAYTLTFGSLLVVAGRAGDVYGRRRLFTVGLALFTVASVASAAAPHAPALFAARSFQGLGAACMSPAALAMLTSTFAEGEARNRALGLWAAVGSGGAILGQVLGGTLTELFGWRSVFLVNVPIGAAVALGVVRLVPESYGERQRLDLRGAAVLAAAVALVTVSLTRIAEHGIDGLVVAGGAAAGVLFFGFRQAERRHPHPLVKPALLALRGVALGNGILALLAGGTAAALFFTTLYLQGPLEYPPFAVGLAFAPVTAIVLLVSPVAGRLVGRYGARALLLTGTASAGAGLVLLTQMSAGGTYATHVLPGLAAVALGNGLAYAPTMIVATSRVADADQGLASGLIGTSQELGTAFGLAIAAPVAAATVSASDTSLVSGYRAGVWVAAALVGAAVVLALRTPGRLGRASSEVCDDHTADTDVAHAPMAGGSIPG
jgi:MFS family permease